MKKYEYEASPGIWKNVDYIYLCTYVNTVTRNKFCIGEDDIIFNVEDNGTLTETDFVFNAEDKCLDLERDGKIIKYHFNYFMYDTNIFVSKHSGLAGKFFTFTFNFEDIQLIKNYFSSNKAQNDRLWLKPPSLIPIDFRDQILNIREVNINDKAISYIPEETLKAIKTLEALKQKEIKVNKLTVSELSELKEKFNLNLQPLEIKEEIKVEKPKRVRKPKVKAEVKVDEEIPF